MDETEKKKKKFDDISDFAIQRPFRKWKFKDVSSNSAITEW